MMDLTTVYFGNKSMSATTIGRVTLIFSYRTLVALRINNTLYVSTTKYSPTTSKHITEAKKTFFYNFEHNIPQRALEMKAIKELNKTTKEILLSEILN